jgi:hypothetical protein
MAWTGNFKDQISALTNGIPDDTEAKQWSLDGCYDVVEKAIRKSGEDEMWKFLISSGAITAATTDIDETRTIAAVSRDGKMANKGKKVLSNKYKDNASIYEATVNHPVWWIENNSLHIYPAPTGGNTAVYYYVPEFDFTGSTWDTGIAEIPNFPSEYYYHAMLYTAVQVLHSKMTRQVMPTTVAFVLSAPEPPTIPQEVIGIPGIATIAKADITQNVPVYVAQTIGHSVLGNLASLSYDDLATIPAAPVVPSLTVVDYTPVTAEQMDIVGDLTIADVIPTSSVPAIDIDDSDVDANFPTMATFAVPIAPDTSTELAAMKAYIEDEDTELSKATSEEINAILSKYPLELQEFSQRMQDEKGQFEKQKVIFQQKVQEAIANAQNKNNIALQNMQKDMGIASTNLSKNIEIAKTNVGNEQARKQLNAQQKHQALLQNATQAVAETSANNASLMQEFQQSLALYNATVDNQIKEYQQTLAKKTQLWQGINAAIMSEHAARAGEELKSYNAQVKKYDADIQAVMAHFQQEVTNAQKFGDNIMQTTIQNYTFELDRWQKSLALYNGKVQAHVQEYTQNLQKLQAEVGIASTEYQWLQDQYNRLRLDYEKLFGFEPQAAK